MYRMVFNLCFDCYFIIVLLGGLRCSSTKAKHNFSMMFMFLETNTRKSNKITLHCVTVSTKAPATEKCLQSLSGPWSPGHCCAGINLLSSGCRHGCQGASAAIFVTRKQPTFHICPHYNNHSPAAPRPVVMSKPLS